MENRINASELYEAEPVKFHFASIPGQIHKVWRVGINYMEMRWAENSGYSITAAAWKKVLILKLGRDRTGSTDGLHDQHSLSNIF